MKKLLIALTILTTQLLFCCDFENEKGAEVEASQNSIFRNEKFEWEIDLNPNWRNLTKVEKILYDKVGDKAAEKEFKNNRTDTWTEILNVQSGIQINQMSAQFLEIQ